MLQGEHSAILPTFIKLPSVFKKDQNILSIFEWPLKTGFTVVSNVPKMKENVTYLWKENNCLRSVSA